ncbi:E3 SUMO-protein ligase ZBED1-like [Syngnathus scovelli]|uniref:E3 SUMO-protein ligase ZBED1-like n=1 Tax=Syngnathus scovelli TaxID=161590 RepID=UPI00210FCA3E|nr:E3 SUMO-protein ligase ZBED1-like [Syngnathus scovelli]XP_049577872.1 E3 SUMO-protein ligase ZBED1-like [Syngnathus scovelli]
MKATQVLSSALNEWNIANKEVVLVTDNAANMVVAAQLGNLSHLKCYAQTLNLAAQCALKVQSVARLLCTFFHRSTVGAHQLEENHKLLNIPKHKLKVDCCTRWSSAFEMVSRFLEQQPAITATLLSPQVRRSEKDLCTLSEVDVTNAEDIIAAFKPLKDATTVMSTERSPTISRIAPLRAKLLNETKDSPGMSPLVREIKRAIHENLSKRYSSEQEKQTLQIAAAPDPRFKSLPFLSEVDREETYDRVVVEAAAQLQQNEKEDKEQTPAAGEEDPPNIDMEEEHRALSSSLLEDLLGKHFTQAERQSQPRSAYARAQEEVYTYCTRTPALHLSEDPLDWWARNAVHFPLISRLAKRYLCIPGTSVAAERVFSTAGDIITAQRSTLSSEHVDQLLFLYKNVEFSHEHT